MSRNGKKKKKSYKSVVTTPLYIIIENKTFQWTEKLWNNDLKIHKQFSSKIKNAVSLHSLPYIKKIKTKTKTQTDDLTITFTNQPCL